jgi:hypothetical protein
VALYDSITSEWADILTRCYSHTYLLGETEHRQETLRLQSCINRGRTRNLLNTKQILNMGKRFDNDPGSTVSPFRGNMYYFKCNLNNGRSSYTFKFIHIFVFMMCFIKVERVSYMLLQ